MTPSGLPTFLIVGAMRSGTTSLARYIGAHPQVHVAPEKEVHFFDQHFDRGLAWYASRLRAGNQAQEVGEATQVYMYDPLSIDRIAQTLPDVRLVAILRDPVERAYSHYRMNRSLGIEPLAFSEALEAEAGRLQRGDRRSRFAYSYVDRGLYAKQLLHLSTRFDRERIHVVLLDQMRSDPRAVYESLCRFLSVDPSYRPASLGRPLNEHVRYRSIRVRRLTRQMPHLLGKVAGRLNTRSEAWEPMEREARVFLESCFRGDARSLAEFLKCSLPWSSLAAHEGSRAPEATR